MLRLILKLFFVSTAVSSAYVAINVSSSSTAVIALWVGMPEEKIEYRVGSYILPFGTPASINLTEDLCPSIVTLKVRPSNKLFTTWNSCGVKMILALCRSPECLLYVQECSDRVLVLLQGLQRKVDYSMDLFWGAMLSARSELKFWDGNFGMLDIEHSVKDQPPLSCQVTEVDWSICISPHLLVVFLVSVSLLCSQTSRLWESIPLLVWC